MARIPDDWYRTLELNGLPVPVLTDDETAFRRWCAIEEPVYRDGVVNLIGLQLRSGTAVGGSHADLAGSWLTGHRRSRSGSTFFSRSGPGRWWRSAAPR